MEGRGEGDDPTMRRHAIRRAAHRMLADAEVEHPAGERVAGEHLGGAVLGQEGRDALDGGVVGAREVGRAAHGGTRVFGGTFLTFSDYMRPSVRLAALMQLPVTYVWTHDSIGLGEDGPTHQPIEHLAALRAIPGLDVVRPADANETVAAWKTVLEHNDRPAGLCLSRQNVPVFPRGEDGFSDTSNVHRGGYVLLDSPSDLAAVPDVVLIGTGSEVALAVEAREALATDGIKARVVSLPSWDIFAAQSNAYKESVLGPKGTARVSVEAGATIGWERYTGANGASVGIDTFGASGPGKKVLEAFGFTKERVAATALRLLGKPDAAAKYEPSTDGETVGEQPGPEEGHS